MALQQLNQESFAVNDQIVELKGQLRATLKNQIGISIGVELHQSGSIPRSAGGKLKRVVDNRNL